MSSMTGKEAADELSDLSVSEREKRVLQMVKNGDVPDYIAKNWWNWVTVSKNGHTLRYVVAPYFAVGNDDDPLDIPLRPVTLQTIADYYDAIIPSRLMITQIQDQAKTKIPFQDVKGPPYKLPISKIETWDAIKAANNMTNTAMDKAGTTRDDGITIGYKKSVVSGPNLDGSRVAIYGARGGSYNGSIQPYSTIHESNYVDYSHGGVLVSRKAELDGESVDLREDVFGSKDPSVYGLVSDQGRFDPVFPNAGSGSLAEFSTGSSNVSSTTVTNPNSIGKNSASSMSSSNWTGKLKTGGIIAGVMALTWWIFS